MKRTRGTRVGLLALTLVLLLLPAFRGAGLELSTRDQHLPQEDPRPARWPLRPGPVPAAGPADRPGHQAGGRRPRVLHHDRRIGKNGRPIRFYKFRTMVVGADRLKAAAAAVQRAPRRPAVQDEERPPRHPGGPAAAQAQPGRVPPDAQRAAGQHEPGGSQAAPAGGGGGLPGRRLPAPGVHPGNRRPAADRRPEHPGLQGMGGPGPEIPENLVLGARISRSWSRR